MEMSGQHHDPAALSHVTHWICGWMDPRVGPDAMKKRKSSNAGNRNWAIQPADHCYTKLNISTPVGCMLI
jgi:hypothetical protein